MVWQPRHEDIIGTFLFFLITGFAVFQIMIGYRRTRGLSFYGASIRPAVNYMVGGALLAGGFAWYFSNPANRNVPGIEGFMSLVCMGLGLGAAALLSALMPTLAIWLRRRGVRRVPPPVLRSIYAGPEGQLAMTGSPVPPQGRLTVLVCDLDGITRFSAGLAGGLAAGGTAVAVLAPAYFCPGSQGGGVCNAFVYLLGRLAEWAGQRQEPLKLDVAGLGLGAELASHMPAEGPGWRAHSLVLVNPRPGDGINSESELRTMTPGDIVNIAWRERIWASLRMRRIWRTVAMVALLCIIAGAATTFALQVRWWPVSGTLAGLLASAWFSYLYLGWRHPELLKGGYDLILESLRAQMHEQPFASVPLPRYIRFAPRVASEAFVAEIGDLLSRPD